MTSSSTTPAELLVHAEQLLSGALVASEGNSARLAAVLARQALELVIHARCTALGAGVEFASMRSKLVILRVLGGPHFADAATRCWHGLSAACHRHAFELSPTVTEVRSQCEQVAGLL